MKVDIKRAYDPPSIGDGCRILVDRVWPRGRTKAQLRIVAWMRELAPSTPLRRWFGHDPKRWVEFKKRYQKELATAEQRDRLRGLLERVRRDKLTLVYGAQDTLHNQAVVLRQILLRMASRSKKRPIRKRAGHKRADKQR